MNYFTYIRYCIVIINVCVYCDQQDGFGTINNPICKILEEDASNNDDNQEINTDIKPTRNNYMYPSRHRRQWIDKHLSFSVLPQSSPVYSTEKEGEVRNSSEIDSLEKNVPTEDAITISPVTTNTTTIESATWTYQGISSCEESDEAKTTLIDYPFSVSIQRKGAHYTTGALLDKLWIITTAGEFYNVRESLKLFRVRLGSVDCKRGGLVIPIKKVEIHPYYLHGWPNFDVALMRMAYDVQFTDFIRPIAISNVNGKLISAKFMTTYWPRIVYKGVTLPMSARERIRYNSMRVSMQKLIPDHKCVEMMSHANLTLNEASLCLKPVITHHSVCKPDAGAPVIAEDGLWGITSGWVSPTCFDTGGPTIFTRVSSPSVRSWLDKELLSL